MSLPPDSQSVRDLVFRDATPDDARALRSLVESVWSQGDRGARLAGRLGGVDAYAARLLDEPDACRLAVWQGKVSAFAAWRQDEGMAVVDAHGCLEGIRKWRIEPALLDDLLTWLRSLGVRLVEVSAPAADAQAEELYQAGVFRELGRRAGDGGGEVVRYERKLRQ